MEIHAMAAISAELRLGHALVAAMRSPESVAAVVEIVGVGCFGVIVVHRIPLLSFLFRSSTNLQPRVEQPCSTIDRVLSLSASIRKS
jgi:hypothetical protein